MLCYAIAYLSEKMTTYRIYFFSRISRIYASRAYRICFISHKSHKYSRIFSPLIYFFPQISHIAEIFMLRVLYNHEIGDDGIGNVDSTMGEA